MVGVKPGNLWRGDLPNKSVLAGDMWNCKLGVSRWESLYIKPHV